MAAPTTIKWTGITGTEIPRSIQGEIIEDYRANIKGDGYSVQA